MSTRRERETNEEEVAIVGEAKPAKKVFPIFASKAQQQQSSATATSSSSTIVPRDPIAEAAAANMTNGQLNLKQYITDPEWQAAKTQGSKYHIYLVNNVLNKDVKIFKRIQNPALHVAKKKILLTVAIWNLKLN